MVSWFKDNEKEIEDSCCRYARLHGFMMAKLSPFSIKGIPDRILIGPNRLILFFEFKHPNNKNNKKHLNRQNYIHKKLRQFGFSVYKIKTKSRFKSILKPYIKED